LEGLQPAGMELYMRLLVSLQFIAFGYLTSRYVETNKHLNHYIALSPDKDRRQAEDALKDSEFRWKFAIEGSGDGVWDWNILTDEKKFSPRWKAILGYAESDILPTGQEWENRFHPDDKSHVAETMQAYLEGRAATYVVECRMRCKDKSYKWILGRGMVVSRSEDGKPLRMIGTSTDISFRKEAEAELRIAATAFESREGMMVTDANSVILRVNRAFTEITGYTSEEAVGQTPRLLKSGRHDADFYRAMWETINRTGGWQGEIWDRRKNGEVYPKWITISAVHDDNGVVTHYIGAHYDITERKQMEDQVGQLAFYDPLTKLPNRRLLNDRLSQAMAASKRSVCYGALMFLDLDNFKPLNDMHGHVVGDLLLSAAADRLKSCVREMDTVARFGGDEFVVMLSDLNTDKAESTSQAEMVAEKIRNTLSEPYLLIIKHEGRADGTVEHHCTASIGVVMFINHEASQDDILKWADAAMYQAKAAGRNLIRFHDSKA
jgi:diguanylate cyclase (GGDEF)-like protein/PAS domain S-box-containing protein